MNKEALHYLESLDKEQAVFVYNTFDEKRIKQDIIKYLEENPEDELWQYKKNYDKKYVGDNLIDVFVNNKGKVCKVVVRGNREFFKRLR